MGGVKVWKYWERVKRGREGVRIELEGGGWVERERAAATHDQGFRAGGSYTS